MKIQVFNLRQVSTLYTGIYYDGSKDMGARIIYLTRMEVAAEILNGEFTGKLLILKSGKELVAGDYLIYNDAGIHGVVGSNELESIYTIISKYNIII